MTHLSGSCLVLDLGGMVATPGTTNRASHSLAKSSGLHHRRPDRLGEGLSEFSSLTGDDGAVFGNGVNVLDDLVKLRDLTIGDDDRSLEFFQDRHRRLIHVADRLAHLIQNATKFQQGNGTQRDEHHRREGSDESGDLTQGHDFFSSVVSRPSSIRIWLRRCEMAASLPWSVGW